MSNISQPTNATQAKDRLYGQLARSLIRMSDAMAKTADLCELLQADLDATQRLGGLHAAQYVPRVELSWL